MRSALLAGLIAAALVVAVAGLVWAASAPYW